MKRHEIAARPFWRTLAVDSGFDFYETVHDTDCWDETVAYEFDLDEITRLEEASVELHEMCCEVAKAAVRNSQTLSRLGIPAQLHGLIADSFSGPQDYLYGRFDLAYDGTAIKLLEYNADTPTALFEASVWQWGWREQVRPNNDQWNSIHEKLIARWRQILPANEGRVHFTGFADSQEDRGTVRYLQDTCQQAGYSTHFMDISDVRVGANSLSAGATLVDDQNRIIDALFKLYPWEWIWRDPGVSSLLSNKTTNWIEPPWKMVLSNKGFLALLWEAYPNHPLLLPTFIEQTGNSGLYSNFVRKPILGREGSNILVVQGDKAVQATVGSYGEEGFVRQGLAPISRMTTLAGEDRWMIVGSWMVGYESAGMIIRESNMPVTDNWSRLVPHFIS